MRSPAAAILWEFRRRHRWGLLAVAGYLLVLATVGLLISKPGESVKLDEEGFAFTVIVPLAATFMYFLAIFSFGLAGDLAGRDSIYPSRMFTLPVTSAALAGWPMLYGAAAMALLWLAARLLAVSGFGESQLLAMGWPSDVGVPVLWPGLLAAAILAWTQALAWLPYPLPGMRVAVTVLLLVMLDVVVLLALYSEAPEPVMLALLAPQVPLAYGVARVAVARARRGEAPDWRGTFAPLGRIVGVVGRPGNRFPSAGNAQAWFEWRSHGRSLPVLVGILLPFELALLFAFGDTPVIVLETLLFVLFTPPFMAAFVAATVVTPNSRGKDSYGLTPFLATRPLANASLLAAKMKVTLRSTLAAWLLVLVALPLALVLSGVASMVIERVSQAVQAVGTPRVIVALLLGLAGLMAATWKVLMLNLCIGLTGRGWLVKASVFFALSLLAVIGPIVQWILNHQNVQAALWSGFPWILAVLAGSKTFAAAWLATRLYRGRVLSDRTLVAVAAGWLAAVLALYGLLGWLVSGPFFPRHLLALFAILAVPLVRLAAAPLALAWNRHR